MPLSAEEINKKVEKLIENTSYTLPSDVTPLDRSKITARIMQAEKQRNATHSPHNRTSYIDAIRRANVVHGGRRSRRNRQSNRQSNRRSNRQSNKRNTRRRR